MFLSDIWKISAGLLLLIIANITLGSVTAQIKQTFDVKIFAAGVLKGMAVAVSIIMTYTAGYLNPSISITLGSEALTVMAAVNAIMVAAYIAYGGKVAIALYGIFKIKSPDASSASTSASAATGETVAASTDTQTGEGVGAGKTE